MWLAIPPAVRHCVGNSWETAMRHDLSRCKVMVLIPCESFSSPCFFSLHFVLPCCFSSEFYAGVLGSWRLQWRKSSMKLWPWIYQMLPFGCSCCSWPTGTFATSWICKRIAMPVAARWFWISLHVAELLQTLFFRKKLLSGWLEWKHGWIALRHYLHTKLYKHLYPILSLLWVAWLSKICLLPPLSWCNCRLDTEMSWQANWFVFWFYHVLWLPDVSECVSEHLEMNEIMFFHCFTLYRPYLTGNQEIFQTCRFDHFPGGLNQGINLTNLPNSRRMCRWAWSNCARVSNSFGRCIPLKVVGGWSFHP